MGKHSETNDFQKKFILGHPAVFPKTPLVLQLSRMNLRWDDGSNPKPAAEGGQMGLPLYSISPGGLQLRWDGV